MFEFGARILLAGALVLAAGTTGFCGFPLALGVAGAIAVLALAGHALNARDQYDGAGAGLHAGLESLGIALVLSDAGYAATLGFLTLVPYAWAACRRNAPWAPGAFAAAFSLVPAVAMLYRQEPSTALLVHAGGLLLLGLMLAVRTEANLPIAEVSTADLELRGRFRALREAYNVLETRSADDSHAAALARAESPDAMAQSLRDATGADGAVLFAPIDDGWEALGQAGAVAEELTVPARSALELGDRGATLLFSAGRPVGAVWLPEAARDRLAGVSQVLSVRLAERMEAESERRKRRAAELRMTLIEGGDSPDAVARAVASLVGADSVEFGAMGPFGPIALGRFGPPCALPEALRHESGPGIAGWAAAGAPMVWIGDARGDERLDGTQALRARTASLALVSLGDGRAYAWAAWHVGGSGRPTALSTLRAAEPTVLRWMERAMGRDRVAA